MFASVNGPKNRGVADTFGAKNYPTFVILEPVNDGTAWSKFPLSQKRT